MDDRFSRTLYVGNLPADIKESEIEDLFYKYGRILDIELKVPPRPPCYCFVEFSSSRDAEDAINGRDGYDFDGCRLRVELAHGGRRSSSFDRRHTYEPINRDRARIPRCSDYRVIVRGLPSSASWQDLKDHMRKAGDVSFAEVSRDSSGTYGIVDYTNADDMKCAIRKLDDTKFKNPWTTTLIRVRRYDSPRGRDRSSSWSRSPSPRRSYSRSRSRSPRRTRRSVSRSVSRSRSASRSRSISKSRSPAPRKARAGSG